MSSFFFLKCVPFDYLHMSFPLIIIWMVSEDLLHSMVYIWKKKKEKSKISSMIEEAKDD